MVKNISGVILAGGLNLRFDGISKANIIIDGRPIIDRIIDTIVDVFEEIIIVTNRPEEFHKFTQYRIIKDQYKDRGPLGGIHAALKASNNDSVFVFAGDMPYLNNRIIDNQISYYFKNNCEVLVPQVNQNIEPLHAIYNKTLLNTLEEYLTGDHNFAVREFFKVVNVNYIRLDDSEKNLNVFTNINSPSDISNVGET